MPLRHRRRCKLTLDNVLCTYKALAFKPVLRSNIWGGDLLPRIKGLGEVGTPVGESWEVSAMPGFESVVQGGPLEGLSLPELCRRYGADLLGTESVARYGLRFPLLVKFIDAHRDLSLQVHPDDATAARLHGSDAGKTEMWYVVDARPGASVTLGFQKGVSRAQFEAAAGSEAMLELVERFATEAGSAFMIPAGTLHSVGAGNLLAEIQQSSDLTYRVYDYGRAGSDGCPRPLHIAEAIEATRLDEGRALVLCPRKVGKGREELADTDFFKVSLLEVEPTRSLRLEACRESFRVLMCVGGEVSLGCDVQLGMGQSVLIPACAPAMDITGCGKLLEARI